MSDVTRILQAIVPGDSVATDNLLALVYDDLRRLAALKLAHERPGQTLTATALVHEVYLRLVQRDDEKVWANRGHFFAAAAEAMRRILINRARDKNRLRRGGGARRLCLEDIQLALDTPCDELLAVNEAIEQLGLEDELCANLVKLRFFAGLTLAEVAQCLDLPRRTADRYWAFSRAWLADWFRRNDA